MSFCPATVGSGDGEGMANPLDGVVPSEYQGLLIRAATTTVMYPLDNAKMLIQLGHEPVKPRHVKTFLMGRPALQLPSVFSYMATIKKRDGFLALYRWDSGFIFFNPF